MASQSGNQAPVFSVREPQQKKEKARLAALSRPSHLTQSTPGNVEVPPSGVGSNVLSQNVKTTRFEEPSRVFSGPPPQAAAPIVGQPSASVKQYTTAPLVTVPPVTTSQPAYMPVKQRSASAQTGQAMCTFAKKQYRFVKSLQSILDPGCQVYSSRGWGYVLKSPDELRRDAVEVKLEFVDPGARDIVELSLSEIEHAAYCSIGNCLSTRFGTGILSSYSRDTDIHSMRLGGTDREQEGNHVDLEKNDIYGVIPSAVGMIADTDFGKGEVQDYDHSRRMFSMLVFGEQEDYLKDVPEAQIWTPLAKYVPAAETISAKGTLRDWKAIFAVIFGNLREARMRAMTLCKEYLGVDETDLRGEDISFRRIFDKIYLKLQEMAKDDERRKEFEESAKQDFFDLLDQTRWQLEEQTSDEMSAKNVVGKLRDLFAELKDVSRRDPELKAIVTDFQQRPTELIHQSLAKYGTSLKTLESRLTDLCTRIQRLQSSPQEKELYEVANELYGQLSSPEVIEEVKEKIQAVTTGAQKFVEEKRGEVDTAELRYSFEETINSILRNIDNNRDDFSELFTRLESASYVDSSTLHDLTVLTRRTFCVNNYGQMLGDRVGHAFQLAAQSTKTVEQVQRTPAAQNIIGQAKAVVEQNQGQIGKILEYFKETFVGIDEAGNEQLQAPELEEVLCTIFTQEEQVRGCELSGQEIQDKFASPKNAYGAATMLMKMVLCQAVEKLDDVEETKSLRKVLRRMTEAPITGQDVMDVIVLVFQLPWVESGVPHTLDIIEQVVRRLETILDDETFRSALRKSHEAGVHQKLLEDFRGIDETLLQRAAESGGADPAARKAILNQFTDAVVGFLAAVLPNTPLPDVYQANPHAEVAVGNMKIRDLEFSSDNVTVDIGGRSGSSGRPHTVNSLPDDTVFSLKTKAVGATMNDVVWKVRQLTFPFARAHGLADAEIRYFSLNIGFKLVRIAMSNLRAIERISGKAFGGMGDTSFEFGNQAPDAALQSEEGEHVMFILKHARVDLEQINIDLHGSKRAAMLDSISQLFSNAIRDAIRRQINHKMRENSLLMTGPMNQGLHAGSLKLFVEQILFASIDDVPYITEGELRQMRNDAEAYRRTKTAASEHDWEGALREQTFVVDDLSALELEVVTKTKAQPAAGAWRGGGFVKLTKVAPDSSFHRLLEHRQLDRYIKDAVIVEINSVDVRLKSPDETVAMLREAPRPLEIKFALDAGMWRRYVSTFGPDTKEIIRDVERGNLNLTKVRLAGKGRLEVQRDRYMERSYILTNYEENDLTFTNPLFRMKRNMILYSINGEILLGKEYDEVASVLSKVSRPAMLMLLESPVKEVTFWQAPTDMELAEKNGKIYISDFKRQKGVITRASSEIRVGDELFDLNGKPFPGPYGYNEDLRRLRRMQAPATLGVGRWENDEYQKFDVRITENGMIDAIFGEGKDGRPYIKGFTDVPGPAASNSGLDRGYIILGINDQEFDRFMTPELVTDLLVETRLPYSLRVLDTKLFKEIVKARDQEVPISEAA